MERMDNKKYAAAFEALETSTEINQDVLSALTNLGNERTYRLAEASMGKRSAVSVKNTRFIALINTLQARCNCKLSRYSSKTSYEVHAAGWSRWAALAK